MANIARSASESQDLLMPKGETLRSPNARTAEVSVESASTGELRPLRLRGSAAHTGLKAGVSCGNGLDSC